MTREEALAILAPKKTYTEAEHQRAWTRYAAYMLHDSLFEILFDMGHKTPFTLADVKERLEKILYPELPDDPNFSGDGDDRWFMKLAEDSGFSQEVFRKEAEGGQHVGDCTAVPATCTRCYVDEFYGVDTRGWEGKAAGSRLLSIAHPRT